MRFVYRVHEWLANHVSWVQYPNPKPKVKSLSGHAHGWRARWATRPIMSKSVAILTPIALALFVPYVGVYASILWIAFLFIYFKR